MDSETAVALATGEFEKRHPRETWPEWLSRCTVLSGTHDEAGRWVVSLTATPKEPLGPGEHWEEVDGRKYLVKVDSATGKEWYVLDRAPLDVFTIFEAVVDPETAEVTVLTDEDPSSFEGRELQGF